MLSKNDDYTKEIIHYGQLKKLKNFNIWKKNRCVNILLNIVLHSLYMIQTAYIVIWLILSNWKMIYHRLKRLPTTKPMNFTTGSLLSFTLHHNEFPSPSTIPQLHHTGCYLLQTSRSHVFVFSPHPCLALNLNWIKKIDMLWAYC